jgi:hypothetical protein
MGTPREHRERRPVVGLTGNQYEYSAPAGVVALRTLPGAAPEHPRNATPGFTGPDDRRPPTRPVAFLERVL